MTRNSRILELETKPVVAEIDYAFAKQSIKRLYPRMPKQCHQHGDRQRSQHQNSFDGHDSSRHDSFVNRQASLSRDVSPRTRWTVWLRICPV